MLATTPAPIVTHGWESVEAVEEVCANHGHVFFFVSRLQRGNAWLSEFKPTYRDGHTQNSCSLFWFRLMAPKNLKRVRQGEEDATDAKVPEQSLVEEFIELSKKLGSPEAAILSLMRFFSTRWSS